MSKVELKHTSPLVYQCSWGKIEVERFGWFKDVILLPGSAQEWVWEKGQNHSNAVSVELVERLHSVSDVMVIGLGMETKLRVSPEVLAVTAAWGPNVFLAESHRAVARYNELAAEGKAVSLALHSTC